MAETNCIFELLCEVQKYAWGKLGMDSEVARLSKSAHPDFEVESDTPYAELWMGAHPKAPSKIIRLNKGYQSLLKYIKANPSVLGDKVLKLYNGELPFLFKVLSVNKSLSIQAHPSKMHAEKLFAERPDIYKDPNHKPEMAIALTQFEGLCGFRPLGEIQSFLRNLPEFYEVVGTVAAEELLKTQDGDQDVSNKLKSCFENVMKCETGVREKNLLKLVQWFSDMDAKTKVFRENLGELLLRLNSQFPGDVGCFVIYFLNHVKLMPGEAMFLGANVPHAYLDGNCVECMACSDNVVRAGLTPKLIDVSTLCEMLEYKPSSAESQKFPLAQSEDDPYVKIYNPPVDDFAVHFISVDDGFMEYTISPVDSASILLVLEGNGTTRSAKPQDVCIRPGSVFFISANTSAKLTFTNKLLAFRALCMI